MQLLDGDAEMEYVSGQRGYRYDSTKKGKCLKRGDSLRDACNSREKYESSMEAKKLFKKNYFFIDKAEFI